MSRSSISLVALALLVGIGLSGCQQPQADAASEAESAAVPVTLAPAVEEPIDRYIQVTGTLVAQERAEVAAEIAGRVVATPIERGSRVVQGGELIRISSSEVMAQAEEADANVAQIEARLGLQGEEGFAVEQVPEVANAKASYDLAKAELARARLLRDQQLLAASEFDQRAAQAEVAARQYDTARNAALQQFQSLVAARARASLARKALADAVVRAPFTGLVAERLVSVGDYVTKGTKVASVMRVDPLRVELTVPAQFVAAVGVGRTVTMVVDAYPGETFTGAVRYVSPALDASSRALVVEAELENHDGRLKPGLFATSRIEQATRQEAVLVPAAAVRTVAGAARVFVATGDGDGRRVEERVVATGQVVGDRIEIASGLAPGEQVVVGGLERIVDGVRIATR